MKFQGGAGVVFRCVQPEVVPERERRPVDVAAIKSAIDPLLAVQGSATQEGGCAAKQEATSEHAGTLQQFYN
jgi:hypothetical protein